MVAVRATLYADFFRAAWQLRRAVTVHTYNVAPEGPEMEQLAQTANLAMFAAPASIGELIREVVAIADDWTVAATVRTPALPRDQRTKPEIAKLFVERISVLQDLARADLGISEIGSHRPLAWPQATDA